ncbi:MAG TPA: protocatechuate 3,4-dioxygenase [Geminicoccaceae bacterium]
MPATVHASRRRLVTSTAALLVLGPGAARAALAPTPRQSMGPFYPLELPLDADADLVRVTGRAEEAAGTVLHLTGRVVDIAGRAVEGARIEIWQCDAFGHYHHPGDRGSADPDFQGFGATRTLAGGAYRFRTIEPVPYPGRTPHIHVKVEAADGRRLTTQMYLEGHPLNQRDGLYRRLGDRARLVTVPVGPAPELEPARKSPAVRASFEIVLGATPEDA